MSSFHLNEKMWHFRPIYDTLAKTNPFCYFLCLNLFYLSHENMCRMMKIWIHLFVILLCNYSAFYVQKIIFNKKNKFNCRPQIELRFLRFCRFFYYSIFENMYLTRRRKILAVYCIVVNFPIIPRTLFSRGGRLSTESSIFEQKLDFARNRRFLNCRPFSREFWLKFRLLTKISIFTKHILNLNIDFSRKMFSKSNFKNHDYDAPCHS